MLCIIERGIEEIELIKPLWEKLNSVHFKKSVYFKKRFENYSFDKRMLSIINKEKKGIIKLDILQDDEKRTYVGYCLSSIEDTFGEIESIFIDNDYRKLGLGGKLMESALKWFETNKISNIEINVVYANDEALPFYARYGFHIGSYILRQDKLNN